MLIAKNLELNFGKQIIFDNSSFSITSDQKIGLVGRNGSGKTTLLKVIAGQQQLDSGTLSIQKGKTIAYLPQNVVLLSGKTLLTEALNSSDNLGDLLQEFYELEKNLDNEKNLEKYSLLQHKLLEFDYHRRIIETKKILFGLGFLPEQLEKRVDTLSVGWKMRLVLAKQLLLKADFYLFDEPTNHLDMVAKDWFLSFLKNSNFGFMLVCHDKYFLDKLCEQIYEVSMGKLKVFRGNYSSYVKQKKHNQELLEKKFVEQQKFLKKERELINRFRASATKAKMVQSKLKALEKIEIVKPERKQGIVHIKFNEVKRSGKTVLDVKKLSKSFGDKQIFKNISFQIERGEKVAIIASNGQGKSTLLNTIMGKLQQNSGSFEFGHNVQSAFFQQDQNKSLNLKNSIYQEIEDACSTTEQRQKIRGFLGAFLFSGDNIDKKVQVLSGGEKNRVAMVKVLMQDANLLLLDEPTNHLDIESKEVLLQVLNGYSGTILFVSHDRDFLNHLATHIIELKKDSAYKYPGNYDSFLSQKRDHENVLGQGYNSVKSHIKHKKVIKNNKPDYEVRKKIRNLESKIEKLEKKQERISKEFEGLEYGTKEYDKTYNLMLELEKELNKALKKWEDLSL